MVLYFAGKQVRNLETQLDLANRKIKEYRQEVERSGSVFLGDPSDFNRMLSSRENCEDASFMGKLTIFPSIVYTKCCIKPCRTLFKF
jgi:hypothetical protein